jgi:phospholipase C
LKVATLATGIQHIFVLMLENRSFDHMLGFSGIRGTDAVTGAPTSINGLTLAGTSLRQLAQSWQRNTVSGIVLRQGGKWPPPPVISVRALLTSSISNTFNGQSFSVTQPAAYAVPVGPGHEFSDVLLQLCGTDGENAYLAAAATFRASGGVPPAYPQVNNSGFVTSHVAEIANSGLAGC